EVFIEYDFSLWIYFLYRHEICEDADIRLRPDKLDRTIVLNIIPVLFQKTLRLIRRNSVERFGVFVTVRFEMVAEAWVDRLVKLDTLLRPFIVLKFRVLIPCIYNRLIFLDRHFDPRFDTVFHLFSPLDISRSPVIKNIILQINSCKH